MCTFLAAPHVGDSTTPLALHACVITLLGIGCKTPRTSLEVLLTSEVEQATMLGLLLTALCVSKGQSLTYVVDKSPNPPPSEVTALFEGEAPKDLCSTLCCMVEAQFCKPRFGQK
uniref:Uncharacterized protein n=1 Tax=Eutreptiella gymnastica TaxID=73025 RepID=A0A7S1J4V7_9EUGL